MLVSDLIEILSDMDPDAQVMGAHQPLHPVVANVTNVVEVDGKAYIGVSGDSDYLNQEVVEQGVFN